MFSSEENLIFLKNVKKNKNYADTLICITKLLKILKLL
jgi:hypothetical protein